MRRSTEAESSTVTPTAGSQQLRKLPPFVLQAQRILERTPVAVLVVVVGLVTLLVHGYRLSVAPDVFGDEGTYLLVGTNVARGLGLMIDKSSGIFLWHPPAYFLVEAAYIKLTGLTNADPLAALLSVRRLNIFFSASTAALLMLFGRKLHSYKAGLIMAALFLMDPYVQRINRRNMLETMAMLCVLLGLYIFFTHRPHLTVWQRLGSGTAFGLAVLTKEPMFLELCALIVYVMWFKRSQLRDVAWVAAIACAVYLPYPAWAVAVGQGNSYLSFKLFGINRFLSYITGQRPPSPPDGNYLLIVKSISWLDNLQYLLTQYVTSYLLIVLAAIFTTFLILRFRHLVAVRYLFTWSIFSFGFGLGVGRVDDQYFYYLIVPSIVVAGYVLASLLETVLCSRSPENRPVFSRTSSEYRIMWKPIFAVFFVVLLYNGYVWTEKYAVGSDDACIKAIEYVRTHIRRGETIWISDDATYWFLSPWYDIRFERTPARLEKMDSHESYFIMSSKDAWGGYNGMSFQFYDAVMRSSRHLFEQDGPSFGKIGVYLRMATATERDGQSSAFQLSHKTTPHSSPTATSTPTHIPSPTLSVTIYRSYLGTLYDLPTGLKTNVSLTNIWQEQWNIRGDFSEMPKNSLFNGKPENGHFTVTIDTSKQIQFIVKSNTRQASLSFQGVIRPDGSKAVFQSRLHAC